MDGGRAAPVEETPGRPERGFGEVPSAPTQGFGADIDFAFQEVFSGAQQAPRVLDSFRRLCAGVEHVQAWPGKGVQRAGSYMAGLAAEPFPDLHSGQYGWLEEIEKKANIIQSEFKAVMEDPESLLVRGNRVWAKAALAEAVSYGPNWRTLVLQDRGAWDEYNSQVFPKTKQILTELDAPTLEVFFARQDGNTGIKPHTDNANFIQTTHLGIDVPEGECWIKVGDHTREWKNGGIIICDTSFMHETMNHSDNARYVLIMRHWHPDVSDVEKIANEFLFAALDNGTSSGIITAQRDAEKKLKALRSKKTASSPGGFGSPAPANKKKKRRGT